MFIFYHLVRLSNLLFLSFFSALGTPIHQQMLSPRFLSTSTNISVHIGGVAVLKCRIKDLGPKTVVWRKVTDDFPLTIGSVPFSQKTDKEISVVHKHKNQWDLLIKDVQPRHSGLYECQISARNGNKLFVQLSVEKNWKDTETGIKLTGTEYINLDQTIHLTCNVTGSKRSPDDIDWFFNGQIVRANDVKWEGRLYITNYKPEVPGRSLVSELRLERGLLKDQGNYVCRSSNMDTTGIKVHVLNADRDMFRRESIKDKYSMNVGCRHTVLYHTLSVTVLIAILWCHL